MRSRLRTGCKPYRIASVLVFPPLISAWTCSSIVNVKSCPGAVPQPQLTALSDTFSADADSVPLTVDRNGFVYQSEILWKRKSASDKVLGFSASSSHNYAANLGGSVGGSALISVISGIGNDLDSRLSGWRRFSLAASL